MKRVFDAFFLVWVFTAANAQTAPQFMYEKHDFTFNTSAYPELNVVELHVPNVLRMADQGSYQTPLIVLFDRQNEVTYHYNIQTINFLSGVGGQMPLAIIAGVRFPQEVRFAMTSADRGDDGVATGVERTATYLFDELIPQLKVSFPGISEIILVGHSRTGHLVNYLMLHHRDRFDAGIALSGFIEEPSDWEHVETVLANTKKPFSLYFSAGISFEEQGYLAHNRRMAESFAKQATEKTNHNFRWRAYENADANHITNYGISLAPALIDYFSDFNDVLNYWFKEGFQEVPPGEVLKTYQQQMASLRSNPSPGELHINSIASEFIYNQPEHLDQALAFVEFGLKSLPNNPNYHLLAAALHFELGHEANGEALLRRFEQSIDQDTIRDADEREELMEWYEEIKMR